MHNLLKFNILKDVKTIQKATLFVQKEAGIPCFKFSGKARSYWMDSKNLEVFWGILQRRIVKTEESSGISLKNTMTLLCWRI